MKKFIHVLFSILMVGILIATIFIDNNVTVLFPNTVRWDNAGYFLIALCILGCTGYFFVKFRGVNEKMWKVLTTVIALLTGGIQVIVSMWMPIEISADFAIVRATAIELAEGGYWQVENIL